ncbi:MAG TPA: glutathione S-transferase family protein [Pseudomonadales bacterium]|nr:glutathione S-transferase family protein [Pseudomonadales bacterium]
MTMVVYGAALSPFVRKVRVVLAEKKLPYEQVEINPFALPPDYEQLNPLKRVPAFKDGDLTLADSGVIGIYLEKKYPHPALVPNDPYLAARVAWFEKYADYELAPQVTFTVFRNRVVKRFGGKPSDEEAVKACITEKLPVYLDYLEKELGEQQYIVNNEFSLADIAIATQFANFKYGAETIDASRWPKMAAYIERLHARDSFAPLLERELGFINKIFSRQK